MSILTVNKTKDAVVESSGSAFINTSGIYDITIKFASIGVSKKGAKSVNFNIEYNGNSQTIYGPYIQSTDEKPLEIGLKLVRDKLGVIADVDGDLTIEEEEHAVGKDNKVQEFAVISDYTDLPVKIRLQKEYSRYNGNITEKLVIRNFFREDGASAEEIINGTEIGKRLAFEEEKFADSITYSDSRKGANDAPTPEEVTEWIEAKKAGKAAPKANPTVKKPSAGMFK